MEEPHYLYEAVGRILCRRYLCEFCGARRDVALTKLKEGPEAVLRAIVADEGMICGSAEWMLETAHEALGRLHRSTKSSVLDLIHEDKRP